MKMNAQGGTRRTFSIFGFPTRVRPGFALFLLLLVLMYPAPLGLWVALAMGGFTLIHELGHALAARRSGCSASISLDFMVAFAAYSSQKELSWRSKIFITISGPALQIGSALLVLLAMGINPFDRNDISSSSASAAVWWAGIALGLLNLVPLLPLDGGAIVGFVAERFAPGKGRTAVLHISFGITIGLAVLMMMSKSFELLPLFVFMLMMQWNDINRPRRLKALIQNAELQASGDPVFDGMVIESFARANQMQRALVFARDAYSLCPAFSHAFSCAVLSLQAGRVDEAAEWVAAAYRSQIQRDELAGALSSDEKWNVLRGHPLVSSEWFTHS